MTNNEITLLKRLHFDLKCFENVLHHYREESIVTQNNQDINLQAIDTKQVRYSLFVLQSHFEGMVAKIREVKQALKPKDVLCGVENQCVFHASRVTVTRANLC